MGDYNLNQSMNSPDGANKDTRREVKITICTAKVVSGGLVRRWNQSRYFAFFIGRSFDERFTIFASKRTQMVEFAILSSIEREIFKFKRTSSPFSFCFVGV